MWAKATDLLVVDASTGPAWIAYRTGRPVIVMIAPKPRLAAWRHTSAWRQDRPADVVDELVDALHDRRASPLTPTVLLRDRPTARPSDDLTGLRNGRRPPAPGFLSTNHTRSAR